MSIARWSAPSLALLLIPAALTAQAKVNQYGYPEKHDPKPTTAAITPADLMTRLYIFADDSMMGRQSGRAGNMMGTNYIAAELKRLGIKPGGENGGYFQTLPYIQRKFTDQSVLMAGGQPPSGSTTISCRCRDRALRSRSRTRGHLRRRRRRHDAADLRRAGGRQGGDPRAGSSRRGGADRRRSWWFPGRRRQCALCRRGGRDHGRPRSAHALGARRDQRSDCADLDGGHAGLGHSG